MAFSRCALAVVVTGLLNPASVRAETPASVPDDDVDWAKERQFWSFRAPVAQPCPVVGNNRWPRQPLDYFILNRLEQRGVAPTIEADRRTLIRRLTFDITGLPPTPDEVASFLGDKRRNAYERLVERLLSSHAFGERLATLWLPLARYAEDQAHQVGSDTQYFYPNAWRYREWVINAFNRDLPYDRFVTLQLAADKTGDASPDDSVALGFLGLGPKYYNRNRLEVQADEWEDRVDTVTRAMLGLTVACARCHDHKFDPITMRDYYALAGVFASTKMINRVPDGSPETPVAKTAEGETKPEKKKEPISPYAVHIVEDDKPQDLNVFFRGNVERKGPIAERRFLRVLSDREPTPFKDGSGRMELARAIASRENPLTARVMVNRLWGHFFGKLLVETTSNFGHSGLPPTHPELLDDLAVRFMEEGWSIKSLVKEFVLSSTYRQSSRVAQKQIATDSANELHGWMSRRRLSIEQWRDSVLFVSGQLEATGSKSLELDDPENRRRTVYARVSRLKLNDMLQQFDYPDANVHSEKRSITTTAMQKLFVLNSPFMLGQAKALAARLTEKPTEPDRARVDRAYWLLFGREPSREELDLALEFLRKPVVAEMTLWEQYAQLLLASNEMLYVD